MSVTDIIRGDDHMTNSFRQLQIFKFLNFLPNFSHMSLIHNEKIKSYQKETMFSQLQIIKITDS